MAYRIAPRMIEPASTKATLFSEKTKNGGSKVAVSFSVGPDRETQDLFRQMEYNHSWRSPVCVWKVERDGLPMHATRAGKYHWREYPCDATI